MPQKSELLFALENVTLRLRDRHVYPGTTWRIHRGEHWAIIGENGSGKSTLARALTGETPVVAGRTLRSGSNGREFGPSPVRIRSVSPESYRSIMGGELRRDFARYAAGTPDNIGLANEILRLDPLNTIQSRIVEAFGLFPLLERPARYLSTGEIKRLLLARALGESADLLVLDEPFDGLDPAARRELTAALGALSRGGTTIVLIAHRIDELIPEIEFVLRVADCRIVDSGAREAVLGRTADFAPDAKRHVLPGSISTTGNRLPASASSHASVPLIEFRNVTVQYGEITVFENLTWAMRKGENWCITGPNGSGKTTILDLIYGENVQSYSNDVRIFGARRGDGESVWEIKARLGIVTPKLQVRYDKRLSVADVITSGLFDSIGLYNRPTDRQLRDTRAAAATFRIDHLLDRRYDLCSAGERTLVLIARALIKKPCIAILDEPCQGLDPANRARVLEAIDAIGNSRDTDLLYVSHHTDEIPECITHTLKLG